MRILSRPVSRREFLADSAKLLAAGTGAAALLSCDLPADLPGNGRPNFIVIMADDLGFGDVGCNGPSAMSTPRIDALAAQGATFSSYYVPSPICSTSRFGFLTGRYSVRSAIDHVLGAVEHIGIPDWEITIAGALRPVGYRSACIGKWHLGNDLQFLPVRHGFDYFFGLPHSNDQSPLPLYRNEDVIEESPDQDLLTQRYTDEAVSFIRENRTRQFFLYLAHTSPHTPLHASPAFRGTSPAGLYGDVISELDWSVGKIVDTVAAAGIERQTVVIFTSDNGPWLERGQDGGSAGPLRGGKATVFEGGIRVPFVVRWPAAIVPGSRISEPVSALDVLPTLVTLAGGTVPRDRVMDGRDAWATWSASGAGRRRALYFYVVGDLPFGIRLGPWKMHLAGTSRRLYNLDEDTGEQNDLAATYPQVVERLSSIVESWRVRVERQRQAEGGV